MTWSAVKNPKPAGATDRATKAAQQARDRRRGQLEAALERRAQQIIGQFRQEGRS